MNENTTILYADKLDFSYTHGQNVLHGVELAIHHGELITLLGPNGAGKSTFMNCLMGFFTPQKGHVFLNGENIASLSNRLISRKIAYVSQNPACTFGHIVREYIAMGRAPYLNMFEKPSRTDYELVDESLERMGIEKLAYKSYLELSGGERQLVNVCRALVQQPKVILFDEPTSALDYGNQIKVLRMVKELSQQGYSILISTHNPDHPILLGGTVCVLSREGELRSGTPEEIMTEDYLNEIYQARLKIRYMDDVHRMVCVAETL